MKPPRRRAFVPREKHEQTAGVGLLIWCKAAVYVSGTSRRKGDYQGTNQTPGIPDVLALLPRNLGVLWWEAKSRRGTGTPEQIAFSAIVAGYEAAGLPIYHCLGHYDILRAKLVTIGLLRPDQVPHYALPASAVSVAVAQRQTITESETTCSRRTTSRARSRASR